MTTSHTSRKPGFHEDMKCGACGGPLEDDRTAVCHTCTPESVWFEMAAAAAGRVE